MSLPSLPSPLDQRYEVKTILGQGGFGTVLRVYDRKRQREVALKLLKHEIADTDALRRFQREAKITSAIQHPHIVHLLRAGVTPGGQAFIAYEFVAGKDLASSSCLGDEQLKIIGIGIAEALEVVHQAGVIHRDLKPANILLRSDGSPVLCDFGVARSSSRGTIVTSTGILLGTPEYMAPELWRGKPASPASDQWAWAATLYLCLYGQGVLPAGDVATIMRAATKGPPPKFPALPGGTAPHLIGVLARALSPRPEDRFPNMAAFAQVLKDPSATPVKTNLDRSNKATVIVGSSAALPFPDEPSVTQTERGRLFLFATIPLLLAVGILYYIYWQSPAPTFPSVPTQITTSPGKAPSAVSESHEDLQRALKRLRELLPPPPPGKPYYLTTKQRANYLDSRGRSRPGDPPPQSHAQIMLTDEFVSSWDSAVQAYRTWLVRVAAWKQRHPRVRVVDLPGVRQVMVEVGLRELPRIMLHLWFLRQPTSMALASITPLQRVTMRITPGLKSYFLSVEDLGETLRSPPFQEEPLALASDAWLTALRDLNYISENILHWIKAANTPPFNCDRAWLTLVILRAAEGDIGGHSRRCLAYSEFAAETEKRLPQVAALDLAPSEQELRAILMAFAWMLRIDLRCEDLYQDTSLSKLLDRQFFALDNALPRGAEIITRVCKNLVHGTLPIESLRRRHKALKKHQGRVETLLKRAQKHLPEEELPASKPTTP
jgi:serine/threonine-protein kinase